MTIYYRDALGIVSEQLPDGESGGGVEFCDGDAYFTVECDCGETVELFERKIPVSALLAIER